MNQYGAQQHCSSLPPMTCNLKSGVKKCPRRLRVNYLLDRAKLLVSALSGLEALRTQIYSLQRTSILHAWASSAVAYVSKQCSMVAPAFPCSHQKPVTRHSLGPAGFQRRDRKQFLATTHFSLVGLADIGAAIVLD